MAKKETFQRSLYSYVILAALFAYFVSIISLISAMPEKVPVEWMSTPLLTLDYPLQFFAPVAAFAIGYLATRNKILWSRLFDGAAFAITFWWLQYGVTGLVVYLSPDRLITILLPALLPLALLTAYAVTTRRQKAATKTVASLLPTFMFITIAAALVVLLFQVASIGFALTYGDLLEGGFALHYHTFLLLPPIALILFGLSYLLLRRYKSALLRWYVASIAAGIYLFISISLAKIVGFSSSSVAMLASAALFCLIIVALFVYHARHDRK